MFGYAGKILDIDLTVSKVKIADTNEETTKKFIGGKGYGAKILFDMLKPGIDPLSPENILIFISGPLTGLALPSSARWCVTTKSPLTGIFLDSQVGGSFGVKLKQAGFDAIIIRGSSSSPVYLQIENGDCKIIGALDLRNKNSYQVERILKSELGRDFSIASIGIAGEKLVRYACINVDIYRQAGRGGSGAVMGSKNLKAIAISGKKKLQYYDFEKFKHVARKAFKKVREHSFTSLRTKYGTPVWVNPVNTGGLLPTRNFQSGIFEHANEISGEQMREKIVVKDKSCPICPVKCWKHSLVREGKHKCELVGPEYETIAMLGSNCLIKSIEAIAHANQLCDDLGLDTISTGNIIAFTMECSEKNFIPEKIAFGDEDSLIELIKKIGYRQGIGDVLAEGVKRASEKLNAQNIAVHVKGMEVPGYDPRGAFGMALAYATSDRGACHQRAWTVRAELEGKLSPPYSPKGRAQFVKVEQDSNAARFSLVLCDFMPFGNNDFVDMLNLATGFNFDEQEYTRAGERIWNLTRLFNVREGISRKDDTLPKRFMDEPLPSGPAKGQMISKEILDRMLDEYYQLRGWDENGIPKKEKLTELGLA